MKNKKIVATNRIIEETTSSVRFKKSIDEAIQKFQSNDFGLADIIDKEQNALSIVRGYGLIIGCYRTLYGMVHVFLDGKQERITIAFADEVA